MRAIAEVAQSLPSLAAVSSTIASASEGLASISPGLLSPIVGTLGGDLSSAIDLRFSVEGILRLSVCFAA